MQVEAASAMWCVPVWSVPARALWAKSGDGEDWLDLPRHLTDSAAVGSHLWNVWLSAGARQYLESSLPLAGHGARLMAWLCGVHDVGKAEPCFAAQLEETPALGMFGERIRAAGLPLGARTSSLDWYPHSAGSERIITDWATDAFADQGRLPGARDLAAIAGAHHGLPAGDAHRQRARTAALDLGAGWTTVQWELMENITEFTGAREVVSCVLASSVPRTAQMLLTGLVIMADWIASNSDLFPLSPAADASSWERAATALDAVDLTVPLRPCGTNTEPAQWYAARFGWPADRVALPAQVDAMQVAQSLDGPALICLEAPMGSGKTEAALAMAEILVHRSGRGGVMVAAPTMATSDALLTRVRTWAESAAGEDVVSLYLGHSKERLNEEMRELRRGIQDVGEDEPREFGNVVAHQWLAGRKKGILSTLVVGTVDQLLFMALQSKHAMLRHLGLANKAVVIDEVHSYSEYMNSYLSRALEWLGAYGVPVIMLSATLSHDVKAQLMSAYRKGLTRRFVPEEEIPTSGTAYPAITVASASATRVHAVEQSAVPTRVAVETADDDDATLLRLLQPVASSGGVVLVLCNTVDRAQRAFRLARQLVDEDARLVHARFVASDRVAQERDLLRELGPRAHSGTGRPGRRVVVSTQVVEQSLDLDFDAMVTDVAPMDVLLQRCGRVHRHRRPADDRPTWAAEPRVWIRGLLRGGDDDTPPEFEEIQELIYPRALLLRTWAVLGERIGGAGVELPQDIPTLVHATYDGEPAIPRGWTSAFERARTELAATRQDSERRARSFQFPGPHGARSMARLWSAQHDDVQKNAVGEAQGLAQVRDSDPTLEVVLTQSVDGGYRPLPWLADDVVIPAGQTPPDKWGYVLAGSSVRLPYWFSRPRRFDAALDELERGTDPGWRASAPLRGQLQVHLDQDLRTVIAGRTLRYDPQLGLLDETPSQTKDR